MKNKFLLAAVEIVGFNLVVLFMVYKFYIAPKLAVVSGSPALDITQNGLWIFVFIYMIGMIGLGFHIYGSMVKPAMQAQKKLEEAAEESRKAELIRKEFVANVSHELKTPLTSIAGFIETLQEGAAESPEIRTRFIDIIAIETSRLKRLIEDLLVLSDIENKRGPAETSGIDIKAATEEIIVTLQPIADKKKVCIITDFGQDIDITGNADRFKQMLMNLIENAIKYSDEGDKVWVTAQNIGDHVCVSVKDEGIGIAEEHLERLFERFYRVDKSRSQKAGGTGLGLSIVKHIAALFNADLKVESKVGEGTIFYITFER